MSSTDNLENQDSLLPIFKRENYGNTGNNHNKGRSRKSSCNTHSHLFDGVVKRSKERRSRSHLVGLNKLDSDSVDDIDMGLNDIQTPQNSVAFNHEAGRTVSSTILKTSPAMHQIAVPDLSVADLSILSRNNNTEHKVISEAEAIQGTTPNVVLNAHMESHKRDSVVSSSATSLSPVSKTNLKECTITGASTATANPRCLRSASAKCAKRLNTSPNRKGRGNYVYTKTKRTYRR